MGDTERGISNFLEIEDGIQHAGFRWMTIVLFGEGMGGEFERRVGQYPTVGDEVHLVTNKGLHAIYGWSGGEESAISVGQIAGSTGISANINIGGLVSRHSIVVGSTGTGKSNLATVLMETISDGSLPNARTIVIDPHGEYAQALGDKARVFRIRPNDEAGEQLVVPFWALPLSDLLQLTLGGVQPNHEVAIRDQVLEMKVAAAKNLDSCPPHEALTADSPVPFSIKQLWYDLDKFERITFKKPNPQTEENAHEPTSKGDPEGLKPAQYPAASPYNQEPYKNKKKRNIERQLDLMRSRLKDARFSFLFSPNGGYEQELEGKVENDLDSLVGAWIGHNRPITIFDMSGIPSELLSTVVGTMLRIVYDMLFWAQDLPVGGRKQPLLVILDEAHLFIPDGGSSPAHRILSTIAKEGRKYGTGLMLVSQRPSEIDSTILSQCGSMIALRLTNSADRSKVVTAVPDDLGGLVEQLPSLRTGEGIFLGEVMPIPSRIRIRKALKKPVGDDPKLLDAWNVSSRPDVCHYTQALTNWRAQSISPKTNSHKNG